MGADLSPQDLGKPYLTHNDRCVQGEQYKLLAKIGLNLGHVASKPGHVGKEVACVPEAEEVPTKRVALVARVELVAEVVVVMGVAMVVVIGEEVVVLVVMMVVRVVVVAVVVAVTNVVPELGGG